MHGPPGSKIEGAPELRRSTRLIHCAEGAASFPNFSQFRAKDRTAMMLRMVVFLVSRTKSVAIQRMRFKRRSRHGIFSGVPAGRKRSLREIRRVDDSSVSFSRIREVVALGEYIDEPLVLWTGDIANLEGGASAPEVLAIELPQGNFGAGPVHT